MFLLLLYKFFGHGTKHIRSGVNPIGVVTPKPITSQLPNVGTPPKSTTPLRPSCPYPQPGLTTDSGGPSPDDPFQNFDPDPIYDKIASACHTYATSDPVLSVGDISLGAKNVVASSDPIWVSGATNYKTDVFIGVSWDAEGCTDEYGNGVGTAPAVFSESGATFDEAACVAAFEQTINGCPGFKKPTPFTKYWKMGGDYKVKCALFQIYSPEHHD